MLLRNRNSQKEHIQVSPFGQTFLRMLPCELDELDKENIDHESFLQQTANLPRRGQGLNFAEFVNQTNSLLKKSVSTSYIIKDGLQSSSQDASRKMRILHDNWLNEQRLIKHKIRDTQSRMEQVRNGEYDWKGAKTVLTHTGNKIIQELEENKSKRCTRDRSRLKRLFEKKYPKLKR